MSRFKPIIKCACGCRYVFAGHIGGLYTCPRCGCRNAGQLHKAEPRKVKKWRAAKPADAK